MEVGRFWRGGCQNHVASSDLYKTGPTTVVPTQPTKARSRTVGTLVSKDGTTIGFDKYGTGSPIVLVGGAFQYRAFDPKTARMAKTLSARFTVYHYDRRGRGESGNTLPYSVEREIEDIQALIEDAGGEAAVFGMSSGAVLALDAAAHGAAITRLALYEPPLIVDASREPFPADYLAQLTDSLARQRPTETVKFWLRQVGVPAPILVAMRMTPAWATFKGIAHTLPYDGAIMAGLLSGNPLPRARWENVGVPTLAIVGGKSKAWMQHGVSALADVLSNAKRHVLPGQTHMVKPDILAPVLSEFFATADR
jgi:pimeloyl-ACP methyl ester carboxylesterase